MLRFCFYIFAYRMVRIACQFSLSAWCVFDIAFCVAIIACRVLRVAKKRVAYRVPKLAKPVSRVAYRKLACRVSREAMGKIVKLACHPERFSSRQQWAGRKLPVRGAEGREKGLCRKFIGLLWRRAFFGPVRGAFSTGLVGQPQVEPSCNLEAAVLQTSARNGIHSSFTTKQYD